MIQPNVLKITNLSDVDYLGRSYYELRLLWWRDTVPMGEVNFRGNGNPPQIIVDYISSLMREYDNHSEFQGRAFWGKL